MVDEVEIRKQVFSRSAQVHVREDWLTPAGRPRQFPVYEATVENSYLGKSRVIKGKNFDEVRAKCQEQANAWGEQEVRARLGKAHADAEDDAKAATTEALDKIEAWRGTLAATLPVNDRIDWERLLDRSSFPAFEFNDPPPPKPDDPPPPPEPSKSFWEWLIPSMKANRLRQVAQLAVEHEQQKQASTAAWERALSEWGTRRTVAQKSHADRRARFLAEQQRRNQNVVDFRARFEAGDAAAIEEYVRAVFERSVYPDGFSREYAVHFDTASKTTVVDVRFPSQAEVPDIVEFRFDKRKKETVPVTMKKKEHDELYDGVLKQAVLRTIHEVFESVYVPHVDAVVVNGWVTALDRATGNETTSCVISVSANRGPFEKINLARVDVSECIKSLKGLVAGPLSQVAPVKPLMKVDRSDARFIESKEVLADINAAANLAEMPWEDFEHLVRELFSKIFSGDDTEVRVTQASRDGGVDAVAFDPDPIRGGKFVIQAKRYTKVVPVSAVRDLYGTMISEGAAKGILVTTAYFGRDTRDFAKDKPITLIDGSNLVYLLEQHGHRVRIDLDAAPSEIIVP
jgi:restriction system protein